MNTTWTNANPSGTALYNATATGTFNGSTQGVGNLSAQLPTIGTIGGVSLIIVILFMAIGGYLMSRRQ
jgi:hypothetical protein